MKPPIVLAIFKPSRWRASIIGPELCAITRELGLAPHHSPQMLKILERCSWKDYGQHASVVRFAVPEYEGSEWHQDGDHAPGADMDCSIVVWASRDPTQIRYDGVIYQPEPYELVIFDNLRCYHRRPPDVSGRRWLFRQRVRRAT